MNSEQLSAIYYLLLITSYSFIPSHTGQVLEEGYLKTFLRSPHLWSFKYLTAYSSSGSQ